VRLADLAVASSAFPIYPRHDKALETIRCGFHNKNPRVNRLHLSGCSPHEGPEQLLRLQLDERSRCSVSHSPEASCPLRRCNDQEVSVCVGGCALERAKKVPDLAELGWQTRQGEGPHPRDPGPQACLTAPTARKPAGQTSISGGRAIIFSCKTEASASGGFGIAGLSLACSPASREPCMVPRHLAM
jgi:hypothetical protein